MSGGYGRGKGDGLDALIEQIAEIRRRLRELEIPTGTQTASLVAQVQTKLAELDATVTALVATALGNYYTKGETDTKITNPGNIAPGDVTASGQVFSQAPLRSPGSHDYIVTTDYVAGWINSDGTLGTSPSSRTVKKNLSPMDEASPANVDAVAAVLSLVPYWGHYSWDDDGSPLKVFLIAEDVQAAGFGPDVAPVDGDGHAYTVNYSQLVVPLISAVKQLSHRVGHLDGNASH